MSATAAKTEALRVPGIHHVTAISGGAQQNVDFYADLLGLHTIKQTVNFDDPGTHHLYYGDRAGTPGTAMTFFPWEHAARGGLGSGATEATGFSVPPGSLEFWADRLRAGGTSPGEAAMRFDEESLRCEDPDGLVLELVAGPSTRETPAGPPFIDSGMQKVCTNTTILVVEDNPDHVGLIEAVISRGLRGARVQVALRGQGARRHLRGEWSAYEDDGRNNPIPDLIVLDLSLPDGSGFDVLRWISRRERLKKIPVIVFTASTDPEHTRLAEEFGVRRYLQKPAHFGDLVEAIKEELPGEDAHNAPDSSSSEWDTHQEPVAEN